MVGKVVAAQKKLDRPMAAKAVRKGSFVQFQVAQNPQSLP
jgi:hypothetical protein